MVYRRCCNYLWFGAEIYWDCGREEIAHSFRYYIVHWSWPTNMMQYTLSKWIAYQLFIVCCILVVIVRLVDCHTATPQFLL